MFDLSDKRAMNKGFGDGMSRAFEFVATPIVFGGLGYGIDMLVGSAPIFTVVLATFAVVGMFVRLWFGYDAEMRSIEARGRWNRAAQPPDQQSTDLWAARKRSADA